MASEKKELAKAYPEGTQVFVNDAGEYDVSYPDNTHKFGKATSHASAMTVCDSLRLAWLLEHVEKGRPQPGGAFSFPLS